ncbi:2-polyprenylphenol 6-hydroxylase [Paremcibacter congregatus]|mgnify:CR=1 FL=1|uniref:2-polyprenylphenol 6-hydroxylase n=1 Tax=Paremcibacter congregatus TaxID=2043170 RepID=UPI0030EEF1CF|tara:strand:+ start:1786 stop:3321 length:1536 start_codon:yes stop_codon:yes gene_type:complete
MFNSLRHMGRLIRVGYTLSRHDALMDLLSLFGEEPKMIGRFRQLRKTKSTQKGTGYSPLVDAFQSLGPSFIKIGQAMATRPDIVGPDVALDLMRLQDNVPPFDGAKAVQIIEQELDAPLDDLFRDFDITPVAAASIAQVHFATTKDGRRVAVKVLRPDIEKAFARDLESFLWLAKLMERFSANIRRLKPSSVVDTIADTIALEMDLRYEAAAASELKENMADHADYMVPDVDWDLSRRRVLTTTLVDGVPFSQKDRIVEQNFNRKKLAESLIHSFLNQALDHGFFHADLHQGNLFACSGDKITAIDFGIMGRIDKKTRRCLAQILYGFLKRDYDLVARAHFDIGYVPQDQSVEKFTQAIRAIGDPIVGKPVSEISAGNLLAQLFETTETFNMQTQPQLLLLQKTMVTVEGVALDLYPEINMWETSRPLVEKWMLDNLGPQAKVRDFVETTLDTLQRLPKIIDDLEDLARAARKFEKNARAGRRSALRLFFYGLSGGVFGSIFLFLLYKSFN